MLNGKHPERGAARASVSEALLEKPADRVTPIRRATSPVRIGGPADEQEVCRLLLLSHAENGFQPASNERVIFYVRRFLHCPYYKFPTPPYGMFGVIGPVGALEGVAMLGQGQMWYSDIFHIEEYLVFVDPNFRSGSLAHGATLIDWMKDQAKLFNKKLLSGIMSNHRTEAKCRLYRRKLPKMGEYFLYDPDKEGLSFHSDALTGPGSLVVGSSLAA